MFNCWRYIEPAIDSFETKDVIEKLLALIVEQIFLMVLDLRQ